LLLGIVLFDVGECGALTSVQSSVYDSVFPNASKRRLGNNKLEFVWDSDDELKLELFAQASHTTKQFHFKGKAKVSLVFISVFDRCQVFENGDMVLLYK
jgi:hypothetical protein